MSVSNILTLLRILITAKKWSIIISFFKISEIDRKAKNLKKAAGNSVEKAAVVAEHFSRENVERLDEQLRVAVHFGQTARNCLHDHVSG